MAFMAESRLPDVYQIKQLNDVLVAHPNATATRWLADKVFLISTVDVNVTFPSVEIVVFQTVQPQDTGSDQIIGCGPIRRVRYRNPSSEDGVSRVFAPDFLVNLESSRRRPKASLCFA